VTPDRRPTFAVIGAARSSTTAVAWALGDRPDVFVTDPKETHFWAFTGTSPHFTGPGDDEMINRRIVTDPAAYLALYDRAGDVAMRGDGSVSTLYHPAHSIESLRRYAHPDVRLVCLVREPAARARSAHLYLRSRGHEPIESFTEALAAEDERIAAGWHHMWHYRAMSRYAEQLPAFADAFGDRLLVAVAEEVQADPARFSTALLEFLGLDPVPPLDLSSEVNTGGVPRSALVTGVLGALRRQDAVRRAVRAVVPTRVRESVRRANLTPAPDVDLAPLRAGFATDVAAVESILGRRVDAWHR
jgi:hypothetical protein